MMSMSVQKMLAEVIENKPLAGNYIKLNFKPENIFDYKAGQYLSVLVSPQGERRSYSIASYPQEPNLELVVDTTPMGVGSKFLLAAKPGDKVEILGPLGSFTVEKNTSVGQLFVATGSGIVPMRSMICDLLEKDHYDGKVHLIWGMRHESELFWLDEFKVLAEKYKNFEYQIIISQPTPTWNGLSGHVNDILAQRKDQWQGWSAYVCGNQHMITDISSLLATLGVKTQEIYFEKFY